MDDCRTIDCELCPVVELLGEVIWVAFTRALVNEMRLAELTVEIRVLMLSRVVLVGGTNAEVPYEVGELTEDGKYVCTLGLWTC
jgi:hypothetical protein